MKKSGLLTLVIFGVLLLSCPLLAQEKANDPGYRVKQLASESLNSQRYGPAGYSSEAEGHESWVSKSEKYQPGKYGPLGYGTESEGD
jgi:hypothetical protein